MVFSVATVRRVIRSTCYVGRVRRRRHWLALRARLGFVTCPSPNNGGISCAVCCTGRPRCIAGEQHTGSAASARTLPLHRAAGGRGLAARGAGGPAPGALAALHRGRAWDAAASVVAVLGMSMPSFVLGPLLIIIFAVHPRWLPGGANTRPAWRCRP